MDIARAISEPLVSLIEFHNGFNRNIKITFGGLNVLSGHGPATGKGTVAVPTGAEPWGRVTQWRNLDKRVKDAAIFVSEIGITRAASAFEDYLILANAEFDRAGLAPVAAPPEGCTLFARLGATLGANPEELAPLELMTEFFQVARNCVVHRSNRASPKLLELRQNEDLIAILENWTRRKGKGKWKVDVPDISKDAIVQWLPRHAILASDAYYRSAVLLDRLLVARLGNGGLVHMAAHWCFLADKRAPTNARKSPETMIRHQLFSRYMVSDFEIPEMVDLLRTNGKWADVRNAFQRMQQG